MSARSGWVNQDAIFIQTFLQPYNITNDENGFIKFSDINDWVKEMMQELVIRHSHGTQKILSQKKTRQCV